MNQTYCYYCITSCISTCSSAVRCKYTSSSLGSSILKSLNSFPVQWYSTSISYDNFILDFSISTLRFFSFIINSLLLYLSLNTYCAIYFRFCSADIANDTQQQSQYFYFNLNILLSYDTSPFFIIKAREQTCSAYGIECVVNTVVPSLCNFKVFTIDRRETGSSPVEHSSSSLMRGDPIKQTAIHIFLLFPPLKFYIFL